MSEPTQIARPLPKSLLIYDGDCHFCLRWVKVWRKSTGDAVEYASLQTAAPDFPEISRASFEHEVKFITRERVAYGGAEAVFRLLREQAHPGPVVRLVWWMYTKLPGFAPLTNAGYRFVARHRSFFSAVTRWMLPAE